MEHFPFTPDWGPTISTTPRIKEVGFGDGYTQRTADGLNAMLETVQLTFSGRSDAEAEAIIAFFERHGGVDTFTAQIGFGARTKKYITKGEWRKVPEYNEHNTITATFQEVP